MSEISFITLMQWALIWCNMTQGMSGIKRSKWGPRWGVAGMDGGWGGRSGGRIEGWQRTGVRQGRRARGWKTHEWSIAVNEKNAGWVISCYEHSTLTRRFHVPLYITQLHPRVEQDSATYMKCSLLWRRTKA